MLKVLFICTGNTCRSPMAEALFNHEVVNSLPPLEAEASSAGLSVFSNEEAAGHVRLLLGREGIDLSGHRAQKVNDAKVDEADLILVMTGDHFRRLVSSYPAAAQKTYLLKDYAGLGGSGNEITDPLGSPLEKYQEVLEEIRISIKKIILRIKEEYIK